MNKVAALLDQRDLLAFLPPDAAPISVGRDRWRAYCPLTQGDSRSFSIRRHDRGHLVFKCFSCNEGGTVIDLVAKMERVSTLTAIRMLATGTTSLSDDAVMTRVHDNMMRSQGAYLLICNACSRTEELATALDAVIAMDGGSNWEVAPDGIGAVCPRCLCDARQRRAS